MFPYCMRWSGGVSNLGVEALICICQLNTFILALDIVNADLSKLVDLSVGLLLHAFASQIGAVRINY